MYKFLYAIDEPVRIGLCILCLVEAVIALIALKRHKEERTRKNVVLAIVAVITFAFSALLLWSERLTEIPDLFENSVEEARTRVGNAGLQIDIYEGNGNYIKEQNLSAGEVVPKGTIIGVSVEEYRCSEAAIAYFEENVCSEKRDFIGQFCSTDVKLLNDNLDLEDCIGPVLTDIKITEAFLANEEYGICYENFELQNGQIIFREIPSSEQYKLVVRAEGYDDAEFWIDMSWYDRAYLPLDQPTMLHLVKSDEKYEMASCIFLVDEAKEILPWTEFSIRWPTENDRDVDVWHGYTTNEIGRIPFLIYLSDEYSVEFALHDRNGNLHILGEDLILKKASDENAVDYYIQLKDDGTLYVMTGEEFWK